MADTGTSKQDAPDEQGHHPGVKEYVEIGVILAVLTAIEVGLYYADAPRQATVPALLSLTAAKFVLVVLWFMHLRFDSIWFRRLFWAGVIIAGVLYLVITTLLTG